jgi:hypothetical protein
VCILNFIQISLPFLKTPSKREMQETFDRFIS